MATATPTSTLPSNMYISGLPGSTTSTTGGIIPTTSYSTVYPSAPATSAPAASPPTVTATTPTPGPTTDTSGTGGTGGTATTTAQAAAQAKLAAYIKDQTDAAVAGQMQSGVTAGGNYNNQGNSLVEQLQQGQSGIDSARKSIAVNQINSINQLADQIRQGLAGSRVTLANSNALDSSAADAVARIYSNYGDTQRNVINNGAAIKNDEQDTAQSNLGLQRALGENNLDTYKNTTIDQIANQTQQALSSLDSLGQMQGLTGAVDINGLKQQIVKNAQDKIAAADAYVQAKLAGVQALTPDQVAQRAATLVNAGTTSSNGGLTYQQLTPATATNPNAGAAVPASMPLYLKPKIG